MQLTEKKHEYDHKRDSQTHYAAEHLSTPAEPLLQQLQAAHITCLREIGEERWRARLADLRHVDEAYRGLRRQQQYSCCSLRVTRAAHAAGYKNVGKQTAVFKESAVDALGSGHAAMRGGDPTKASSIARGKENNVVSVPCGGRSVEMQPAVSHPFRRSSIGSSKQKYLRACTRGPGVRKRRKGSRFGKGGAMPHGGGGRRRVVGCRLGAGDRYTCEHVHWPCLLTSQQQLHPSPAWLKFEHRAQDHELSHQHFLFFYILLLPLLHASRGSRPCDTAESRGTRLSLEPTTRAPPAPWM